MKLRLVIHTEASEDIDKYAWYLGERSLDAADRFQDCVLETARWLVAYPGAGHRLSLRRNEGLRVIAVRDFPNHLVIYREHSGALELVRVVHGARDLPAVLAPTIESLRKRR